MPPKPVVTVKSPNALFVYDQCKRLDPEHGIVEYMQERLTLENYFYFECGIGSLMGPTLYKWKIF